MVAETIDFSILKAFLVESAKRVIFQPAMPIFFERAPSRFDPAAMRRAVRERRKVAVTYAKAQRRAVDRVVRPVALIHATRHGSATTWKLVCRLNSTK